MIQFLLPSRASPAIYVFADSRIMKPKFSGEEEVTGTLGAVSEQNLYKFICGLLLQIRRMNKTHLKKIPVTVV